MKTIRPTINAQRALSTIQRYFPNDVKSILIELLQNARRAGATKVEVSTKEIANKFSQLYDVLEVSLYDNGIGIEDPSILFSLFSTGWDEETIQREDPAGAGIYSLSSIGATIESSTKSNSWRLKVTPNGFVGAEDITVEELNLKPSTTGTRVTFTLKNCSTRSFILAIQNAARYYPVEVIYNSQEETWTNAAQKDTFCDFLYKDGVKSKHVWEGLEIAICLKKSVGNSYNPTFLESPSLNYYGLTLNLRSSEIKVPALVKINVINCPKLRLKLPDRSSVYNNEFYSELCKKVKQLVYEEYSKQEYHFLNYDEYCEAKELGVNIAESCPVWSYLVEPGYSACKAILPSVEEIPNNAVITSNSSMNSEEYCNLNLVKLTTPIIQVPSTYLQYSWASAKPFLLIEYRVTKEGKEYNLYDYFESYINTVTNPYDLDDIVLIVKGKQPRTENGTVTELERVQLPVILFDEIECETDSSDQIISNETTCYQRAEFCIEDKFLFVNKSADLKTSVDLCTYFKDIAFDSDEAGDLDCDQFNLDAEAYVAELIGGVEEGTRVYLENLLRNQYYSIPDGIKYVIEVSGSTIYKRTISVQIVKEEDQKDN